MAEDNETADTDLAGQAPRKRSLLPLLLGVVLALGGAGGGYFAVAKGLVGGTAHADSTPAEPTEPPVIGNVAYVPLDDIVVSLAPDAGSAHLRFRGQLEVAPEHRAEIELLAPRIIDVLNTYLRALRPEDVADHGEFLRIRAHMLRRVQIVTGEDRVRDLLIMEFVLT